jgi:hypothetical protein
LFEDITEFIGTDSPADFIGGFQDDKILVVLSKDDTSLDTSNTCSNDDILMIFKY